MADEVSVIDPGLGVEKFTKYPFNLSSLVDLFSVYQKVRRFDYLEYSRVTLSPMTIIFL